MTVTRVDDSWFSSMTWLRNITGGVMTAAIIILVTAFVVFAVLVLTGKVTGSRRIGVTTLIVVVLAASAVATVPGIVTWSGTKFPSALANVDTSKVNEPSKADACQLAVDLFKASKKDSWGHVWARASWDSHKCAGVAGVKGSVPTVENPPSLVKFGARGT
ncbi:hypothetical protein FB461_2217 [Rarobacter faecitabidus]|uniref:Uncharacterized protein n=2 Tax=Rarobacter faecitabidus TaxID=13243 RepID=A0A542ZB51_RARFA|nr:hypothetical protein FB461_2217 [Rarobacter faecitabidus]